MTKTILITGASSGIGKAAANLFASKGWNVVATMRDPARGAELATLRSVVVTRLDVQDRDSIAPAIEAGIAQYGRIDALVNNAGYGRFGLFEAISAISSRSPSDSDLVLRLRSVCTKPISLAFTAGSTFGPADRPRVIGLGFSACRI